MNKGKPSFDLELDIIKEKKCAYIAGVDEVGRGCLAGPIIAGAVVFENHNRIKRCLKSINDSKKLSAGQRLELDPLIKENALFHSIGEVSPSEIDSMGIGAANILAFKRALDKLKKCDFVLIDGRSFRGFNYPYRCFEKGESRSISIAAASIVAKVYRDSLMENLDPKYNRYGLRENKGYGSPSHWAGLNKYGLSDLHRKSFLTEFREKEKQTSMFES